jgi:hypothetical protein
MLCTSESGRIHPVLQLMESMLATYESSNAGRRMSAMSKA